MRLYTTGVASGALSLSVIALRTASAASCQLSSSLAWIIASGCWVSTLSPRRSHAGEQISIRDRLSLDGKRAGSYFNHQLVESIQGKDGPIGFIRITLDTHVLATESKQVDNTTNLLRLMILLALAIGIILARTLLQHRRSRWQQSPYLLTANTPLAEGNTVEDDEEDAPETKQEAPKKE